MCPPLKKMILLGISALLLSRADAQLLVDHFGYANGNLGSSGSAGGWANSNSGVTTSSNSLDGTALGVAASSGNKVTTTGSSSSGTYNQFGSTGILTGNVYFSFLLKVNSSTGLSASGQPIVGLLRIGSQSSYYMDAYLRSNGGNVELGVAKVRTAIVWHPASLTPGTIYFVVGKYEFVDGSSNDRVSLWVNPGSLGTTEPPTDLQINSSGDGNDSQGIARVVITGGASADVDEVRVGTSWASATPPGVSVPPASAPRFTETLLLPGGIVLRGTNGPPGAAFDLLASGDISVPAGLWGEVASDNFDVNGHFDLTNPISPVTAQQFYRLRIGNGVQPPVAPEIIAQPTNVTVLANQSASFSVGANGTAPLSYQWFFNTNTPLPGASTATLTLNNVQTNDAGMYSVVITNVAGSASSAFATLTVSNILAPPTILTQPQDQVVNAGQTAIFNISVSGTPPLFYQWFFNTNTLLPDQTNATLSLPGVSVSDAGAYSVNVTNDFGSTNSAFATLTVDTNAPPDFSAVGFCNNAGTITGGEAGPTVYVGSEAELQAYSDVNPPYTIYVTNSFNLSGMSTHIRNNKSVIGLGNVVLTGGGLYLYRSTNVIIRNLTIRNSTEDNIGVHYSASVWIDHCTFYDSADGSVDLTQQSDNLTISWCRFYYTANSGHNFVNLIASSDSDSGDYRVTFHHNWWDVGCVERMPSVRFGRVHCFNNYYNAPGNNYCVRTRVEAELRVENNFFQSVRNPWEQYVTGAGGTQGKLFAANNNVPFLGTGFGVTWTGSTTNNDGTIRFMVPGTDTVFIPPYSYTLDPAGQVPNLVTNHAGAGKGPFSP
jgi:pectate lyase